MPRQAENEPDTGAERQRRAERLGRAERVARPERELDEAAAVRLFAYWLEGDHLVGQLKGDVVEPGSHGWLEPPFAWPWDPTGDPPLRRADLRPAPFVLSPRKVVCVGLNYKDHVTEGGRAGPDRPLLFSKFANAVIASGEPIVRPEGTHALDLEVELGVVIGKQARRVKAADAMSHVAGYVVVNDVSARDWQGVPAALHEGETGDGQWIRAKGSDTFLPMGPVFVTADELDPAAGLRLRSWLIRPDGKEQLMQDSTTASMIWSIPALIEYISKAITLEPGDVIATGTPSGVGVFRDPPVFLEPGDRVRCEIEGIGSVDNPVIDWTEDPRDA